MAEDPAPDAPLPNAVLRALFERLPFGVSVLRASPDGDQRKLTFVSANPQASRESGMDLGQIRGLTVAQAFPDGADSPIPAAWQAAVDTDELQHMAEIPYGDARHPDGWFRTYGVPLADGHVASVYQNITAENGPAARSNAPIATSMRSLRSSLTTCASRCSASAVLPTCSSKTTPDSSMTRALSSSPTSPRAPSGSRR